MKKTYIPPRITKVKLRTKPFLISVSDNKVNNYQDGGEDEISASDW